MDYDEEKIELLLERSIATIYPSKDALRELLRSGKKLRIYVGIDPTATYVHLGHSTNYFILRRFHELGHKIIVLIGDFTAMIGDPSDKTSMRVKLTATEVQKNLETFKDQIGKIIHFSDKKNPVEFELNSKWLAKLTFENAVELASHFTVQQMLERDAFQKRLQEEKPLYVHEFFYPLMQGYDSVALSADIELGGTDQTFNMLAGRTLVRAYQNREKLVITTTLLENPVTGEKLMSKSLGTGIALNEAPADMYGKAMRLPDEALIQLFVDCTDLDYSEIDRIRGALEEGENPRNIKMRLAWEIVRIYHGEKIADATQKDFIAKFQKKAVPDNVTEYTVLSTDEIADLFVKEKIVSSKTEFRRFLENNAITNLETNTKINYPDEFITVTYKVGSHTFVRLIIG